MNPNSAAAIQLAIDLTLQLMHIQQSLQTAQSEGRDITKEELDTASNSADASLARLKASIDSIG